MSIMFKRDPLGEMPSMTDYIDEQAIKGYEEKINEGLRARCEIKGWTYFPERIRLITDLNRNRLYYYQTDTGSMEPLMTLSPMQVSLGGTPIYEGIRLTMESRELHPDVFKPAKVQTLG